MTEFFYLLTTIFDLSIHFILVVVAFTLLFYLIGGLKRALLFFTTLTTGAIIVSVLKMFFDVNRPAESSVEVFGKSFPSGHATIATIFFIMTMYLFSDHLSRFQRILFNFSCIALIFLVSYSRIYLNAHWFSDVLFGVVLGITVSYGTIKVYNRM